MGTSREELCRCRRTRRKRQSIVIFHVAGVVRAAIDQLVDRRNQGIHILFMGLKFTSHFGLSQLIQYQLVRFRPFQGSHIASGCALDKN